MANPEMQEYCEDCCDFQSHTTILPVMKDRFIASVGCCPCCIKDGAPVKPDSEIRQYELLAWQDDGEGGVCLIPAAAETDPELWAGFALQCFRPGDEGGIAFYAEGGFLSHMACLPEGVVFDAMTMQRLRSRGLYPVKTYGMTEVVE